MRGVIGAGTVKLRQLLPLVRTLIIAEDFGVRVHDQLPAITMTLSFRDQLFVHARLPQPHDQALPHVPL